MTIVVVILCWLLASILTAIAFCRALGAADMREQALDQRSDAAGTSNSVSIVRHGSVSK